MSANFRSTSKKIEPIDFSKLPAVGMWADREDMVDSVEYIRKLRKEQWG
ncbi:MAG: hypothetical protein Q4B79_01700 [Moraxella sp.]|nr:hypothetical protein [Moraxella sp.]MDO4449660.1 hypothetical protein [Moraxella sp.]